ncbi:ABC transporter permease [Nonomuraea phyllanthi]|uniref:Transport permease protein n=1 Tax=Nonomuraea phyllanthi TaxID=2219224 RepID=A0A5C4V2K9_9ACTN|nr:ABC transporter permease [Nonomuraea phyllanthi]KAB8185196.1 ABC transporter permease [Nonomuraea phyllanthi]QFY13427.1 ABC transporter permease [Nonomuraea phyllanthi]
MTGFSKLAQVEAKLLLRDPGAIFSMAIPLFILVIFSGGTSPGDTALPSMSMTIAVGLVGLYMVPTTLATYRERGILRRLSTTPVSPGALLGVQLILQLVFAMLAAGLLVAVSIVAFQAAQPARVAAMSAAFLLGTSAIFAIGLLIAATAASGRAANGIGVLLYFPLAFLGGLMQPKEAMPELLATIGEFTPLGLFRQAIHDAWSGAATQPLLLAIMAAYALVVGSVAARFFRWE